MKIVVHGQQAFGKAVLERLLEQKENVIAVCTAPDKEGRPLDPLKELAQEHNIPVHQPASWKTPEALELMQSFDADICMMAYVLLFVPQPVLDAPKLGSFQYHPSILPMHRGPSSINWPIAMGSTKTGLTIFWPDEGLDEGPVLLQKHCDIGADESLGDVYFNKLFPMGVDAMLESLQLVKDGKAPRVAQNLDEGSYESWFGKDQAKIDWTQSADDIYNIIRAANPQPSAWCQHGDATLKIFDSEKLASCPGDNQGPGSVAEISADSVVIATGHGGAIRVKRVRADAGKVGAGEYAAASGLAVGDKLV